ncbi:hypothetical protein HBH95_247590 [Parastagonospora nodorum]|nr:hypothetical protein HBH95_247590 [Parastagonospora nodorum]
MLNLRQQRLIASYKRIRGKKRRFKTKTLTQTLGKSVYAVFKCLASSSNLSITIRYANSSSLSQSSSCNYLQRNYGLRLLCLIRL